MTTGEVAEHGRTRAAKASPDSRAPASPGPDARAEGAPVAKREGFFRRYRLPLLLAVVAACLYAGSILYILYGRGQIA